MLSVEDKGIKNGLSFLFLNIGMFIFAAMVITKIDTFYKKTIADTQKLSADLDWQDFQYQQEIKNIVKDIRK